MTTCLLITGFEPFGGRDRNPSSDLAEALSQTPDADAEIVAATLPVVFRAASSTIRALIRERRPDIVLMLGLAGGASSLRVERIGVNFFRGTDNTGVAYDSEPIVPNAPDAYFSTLPVTAMIQAARDVGVPARDSFSAGTYCCNEVLYAALHTCATEFPATKAGFIHLPLLPDQTIESDSPSMAWETQLNGLRQILYALVECKASPTVARG
ncbi:MAG: pyroglutamyl-peptidase I [Candidatus Poribacteria bacterium]|nr:pyroglutamyl-peptidase I [Candidatus Poribacteria bacterium]